MASSGVGVAGEPHPQSATGMGDPLAGLAGLRHSGSMVSSAGGGEAGEPPPWTYDSIERHRL